MESNAHGNSAEQVDVQNALKNYLESLEAGVRLDCFASNCIVDWFNCSVRGPKKIHQFLKHKIRAQQLRHAEFNKVDKCGPIEVKPTHMTTRKQPKPKHVKINKANNYTKSLKSFAESDEDDEKPSVSVINSFDNGLDKTTIPISTPSTSKLLQHVEDSLCLAPLPLSEDEEEDRRDSPKFMTKRRKYNNISKLRPTIPISKVNSDSEAEDGKVEEGEATNKYEDTTMLCNYSPLHYLESTGHLFTSNLTDLIDRMVRLRISYRKNLTDNNIQYALIIYESLQDDGKVKITPRRNIALEFNQEQQHNDEDVLVVVGTSEQEQMDESMDRPSTPIRSSITSTTTTTTTTPYVNNDIYDDDDMNLVASAALRTPTKVSTDPPATPRRRRRDGHMHLKRTYDLVPSYSTNADGSRKPAKKCNAARTLRL